MSNTNDENEGSTIEHDEWVRKTFGADPATYQSPVSDTEQDAPQELIARVDPPARDMSGQEPDAQFPDTTPTLESLNPTQTMEQEAGDLIFPDQPGNLLEGTGDFLSSLPELPPSVPTGGSGKVTKVTLISSSSGALSGFPIAPSGANPNSPGPFNSATTGTCVFVHQIKFDVAGLPPNEIDLLRTKNGVAGPVDSPKARTGLDGPSEPYKQRGADYIAVADTPGIAQARAGFPLMYRVDFRVMAFDRVTKRILAEASYSVNILKQSIDDSNPTCTLTGFASKIT